MHLLRNHEIVLISNELKKTSQWPKIDSLQKLAFTLSTYVKSIHSKGGVILEGILTLVPLPTKSAKSLSCAENLNFPLLTVDSLDKFSAQESDLAIVGNGTKVKSLR